MRSLSAAMTDVGRKRPHNEDAYFHDDELMLYVVADGMGGHAAGEVASWEAIQAVQGMVRQGQDRIRSHMQSPTDESMANVRRLLESGIQAATYMVFGLAEQDPGRRGMGTTITAMLVAGSVVVLGSVGDSRAYLVRDGKSWQVTEDHTLVQLQLRAGLVTPSEMKSSPRGNVITRAVGPRDYVQVDTYVVPAQVGDRYLLCSDGLHGYLETLEIGQLLVGVEPETACSRMIKIANERGGKDNITCVVVDLIK